MMPNGLLKVGTFVCPAWPSVGLRTVVLSHCLSFIVRVPSPTAALSEQGRKKKKKTHLVVFSSWDGTLSVHAILTGGNP